MNYSRNIDNESNKRSASLRTACVLITALLIAGICARVQALEFQCELPGDVRYLRVDIPGQENLCEVSVKYEHNGETKILWYAQNDTMFCSVKAYELKDKYESTWRYRCQTMPDRDGIDKLSPSQRAILDTQLKALINRGRNDATPFRVTGVKVAASTPLDNSAGLLAFQYFMDSGTDVTEIIQDYGDSWKLMTTLQSLTTQIDADAALSSAFVRKISDTGALEVYTSLTDEGLQGDCFGAQVLKISPEGNVSPKTPHLYVCHEVLTKRAG